MLKKNIFVLYIIFCITLLYIVSCNNENKQLKDTQQNTAKPFHLSSIKDNEKYSLEDFRGKPLIINFWASWCAPCREEMPFLEKSWRNYKTSSLNIVGVNINDNKGEALKTLDEFDISYVNLYDPQGKLSNTYGVIALPVTIFIDKTGKIYKQQYGPFLGEKGEQTFNNYVKDIL